MTQVHELNGEALEMQGQWDQALDEYRRVLGMNPNLPGIHYRLGRLLLSKPRSSTTLSEAQHEFEEELKIDPANAGAEYILGELARQARQWAAHFHVHPAGARVPPHRFFEQRAQNLLDAKWVDQRGQTLRHRDVQFARRAAHAHLRHNAVDQGYQVDAFRTQLECVSVRRGERGELVQDAAYPGGAGFHDARPLCST